jgi:Leucine-rich repeat (LRR) protein
VLSGLADLKNFSLKNNNIEKVFCDMFNGTKNLEVLILINNHIESADKDLFDDLKT